MVRPLHQLGVAAELSEFAVRLEAAWEFRRWSDGAVLFVQPMGEECERLYGVPCYVAHRADLGNLLRRALPERMLHLDRRCVAVAEANDEVQLTFVDGSDSVTRVAADAAIGADGIHSVIRGAMAPPVEGYVRFAAWSPPTGRQKWRVVPCKPCGWGRVDISCITPFPLVG